MPIMIEWFTKNWLSITTPAIVFLAFFVVAVWSRRALNGLFSRIKWEGGETLLRTVRNPFFLWCLILGTFTAVQLSTLSPNGKALSGKILKSALIISLI